MATQPSHPITASGRSPLPKKSPSTSRKSHPRAAQHPDASTSTVVMAPNESQQKQPPIQKTPRKPKSTSTNPNNCSSGSTHGSRNGSSRSSTTPKTKASVPEPVPVPTPSKANNDTQPQLSASFVERMKYAGANFQNAPAASALPIPVFVKASVPSSSPPLLSSIKPPLTLSQSATTYNPLLPVTVSAASVVNNERRNPTQNSGVSVQLIAKSHNDDSGVFSMDGLSEDATLEATHSNSQQFFRMAHVNAMIPPPPLPLSQPPIFVGFDQTQFSVYSHHPHFVRPHFPSTPYQQPPVVFSHLVHNDPIQRTAGMAIPQHLPQQQPIVVHQGHKHAGVTPDMSPSISPPPPHLGEMSQNLKTLLKINET